MHWTDIETKDAVSLDLSERLDIEAPLSEVGERCPWPWEPQQLKGVPLGQYHCGYCGAMCVAGMPHIDYRETPHEEHAEIDPGCKRCFLASSATEATSIDT